MRADLTYWMSSLSGFRRMTLAHTSWFRVPSQGMNHFEVLSHGSCFLVRDPSQGGASSGGAPRLLASGHVAEPSSYPRYVHMLCV